MIRHASDFRKLAKLSEIRLRTPNEMIACIESDTQWRPHMQYIVATLTKIHGTAEQGRTKLYVCDTEPLMKNPEIREFFTKSGFTLDRNSIDWSNPTLLA